MEEIIGGEFEFDDIAADGISDNLNSAGDSAHKIPLVSSRVIQPTMEDVFMFLQRSVEASLETGA